MLNMGLHKITDNQITLPLLCDGLAHAFTITITHGMRIETKNYRCIATCNGSVMDDLFKCVNLCAKSPKT